MTKPVDHPTALILGDQKARGYTAAGFRRPAARALLAAALILGLGSVLDVVVLWGMQRQPGPQGEFAALVATAEGLPRIVLAVSLAYAGFLVRESTVLLRFRALGLVLVAVGLLGAVVGGMVVSDYFVLRSVVEPASIALFRSAVFKTLALCTLYVLVLIPVGVLAMRRPQD